MGNRREHKNQLPCPSRTRSTKNCRTDETLIGAPKYSQDLEIANTSAYHSLAYHSSQDCPDPGTTSYLSPLAPETFTLGGAQWDLINDVAMNYPLPSTFISMGSTVPRIDEECDFPPSWELEHASSTLQHFSGSLTSENAFDPLDGFEPTSGLSNSSHLTESNRDGVALLLSTSHPQTATIIQENQLIAPSDLPTSYARNSLARAATTPHGLDEIALDVSGALMTPAQASLFQALLSLGEPTLDANTLTTPSFQPFSSPISPYSPPANPLAFSDSKDEYENRDPERIEATVCGQLALDRNLESNSLPFTLQSYALWMRRAMFDPSRAAHRTRDYVIRHFAESEQSKSRTILIANIFRSIASNPAFDMSYLPKLSTLRADIQKALTAAVKRRANPSREIQIRESVRALEQTLELFAASRYESLHVCLQLMREAATVFRLACPEPADQLVHLPTVLMHPNANMRHYPVMDVYFSILTGLPTNLRYDTSLRTPVDASVLYINNHLGLSWLYGQPDQLTLILARINSLYQDFGSAVDQNFIQEIEQGIRDFKASTGSSPDPSLLVMRLVVQECWRQLAYIYLYMTLCNVDSSDARVRTAQQRIMKLIRDSKSTAALDMHLAPCLGIAGAVTWRPAEREMMLARLRGLPECSRPESCFSICVMVLREVWRQTDREDRPANWADFRLATLRVLGI